MTSRSQFPVPFSQILLHLFLAMEEAMGQHWGRGFLISAPLVISI